MKIYTGENIRNLAVVGHSHAGKTTLVSAMLYTAGATPKQGRVDDGSTVTDYDEEEIVRQMSISNGVCFCEFGGSKINFMDTPGFNMFVHEAKAALVPAEAALVVVDGVHGVEVMTDRPDDPHLRARAARDRPAEHPVGLALAVDVGGDHRPDRLVGRDQLAEALVVERLAKAHEASAAPRADGGLGEIGSAR